MLSREGEGQQVVGRASLDIFSPVREGQTSFSLLVSTGFKCSVQHFNMNLTQTEKKFIHDNNQQQQ